MQTYSQGHKNQPTINKKSPPEGEPLLTYKHERNYFITESLARPWI
jgi:hypothetical protein